MTTSAMVSINSNCTSSTEARMVPVRSVKIVTFTEAGSRGLKLGKKLLDAVDHADDVGAGLALNIHQDRGIVIGPRGLQSVFHAIAYSGDIRNANRSAVAVRDDDRLIRLAAKKLIVGADGVGLLRPVERAFGLIDVGVGECGAKIFQAHAV